MLHVAHSARLDKVGKDGSTVRAHLEAEAARGNRSARATLERHPAPPELEYLHRIAIQLVGRSGVGQFGFAPLSYTTIKHWSELTDTELHPLEVNALVVLDAAMRDPGDEEAAPEEEVSLETPAWPTRRVEPVFYPSID